MARTHGHGNPKWTRDETILALDLYFKCDGRIPSHRDPRVKELSNLLLRLPYHSVLSRKESFRNPDGVAFKLQNLHKVATGKGLGNVSKMDRTVWTEFGSHPDKVKQLADLIRGGIKINEIMPEEVQWGDDDEFVEGRILTELHKRRERNPNIRKRLIALRRMQGKFCCEMCSSPPKSGNPKLEDATFEAHHIVPVSSLSERLTRLSDVALLCANCHRLLHRAIAISKRWINITEGRALLT